MYLYFYMYIERLSQQNWNYIKHQHKRNNESGIMTPVQMREGAYLACSVNFYQRQCRLHRGNHMPQCRNKLHIPINASNSTLAAGELQLPILLLPPISLPPSGSYTYSLQIVFHPCAALRQCSWENVTGSDRFSIIINLLIHGLGGFLCKLHKVESKYTSASS